MRGGNPPPRGVRGAAAPGARGAGGRPPPGARARRGQKQASITAPRALDAIFRKSRVQGSQPWARERPGVALCRPVSGRSGRPTNCQKLALELNPPATFSQKASAESWSRLLHKICSVPNQSDHKRPQLWRTRTHISSGGLHNIWFSHLHAHVPGTRFLRTHFARLYHLCTMLCTSYVLGYVPGLCTEVLYQSYALTFA